MVKLLRKTGVPIIYFGTDSATLLPAMKETGADVIGLDWRIPLDEGWSRLDHATAVQGNLDPVLLFAETFRMGGHATHDEREARELFAPDVFEYWGKRDPIGMYESCLQRRGVAAAALEKVENQVVEELASAEKEALESFKNRMPKPEMAIRGVYASQDEVPAEKSTEPVRLKAGNTRKTPSR